MTAAPRPRPRYPLRTARLWERLALGFGTLVVLMLVVVGLAISQFRSLARQAEQVTQRDLQSMLLVQQVHQHAQGHGSAMARLLTAPRAERELIYPAIDAEYVSIEALLEDLGTRLSDGESARQLQAVAIRSTAYREAFTRVGELLETEREEQARAMFNEVGQPALSAVMDAANGLLAHEQERVQGRQLESQIQIQRSEWLLLGLAGVALVLSVVLAWRTTVSVAAPLHRVETAANRIADGDYTTTVEVRSRDELGRVALAINAMASAVATREAQIERLAFTDRLTGLPNRTKLRQLFPRMSVTRLSVILMDVARLRTVNEVLGFDTGDAVLAQVAERLQGILAGWTPDVEGAPKSRVLARLAGGVFAVLIDEDRAGTDRLRARIDLDMATPVICGGSEIDVQLVYGMAEAAAGSDVDVDALLRRAEIALGEAKRSKASSAWHVAVDDSARARQLSLLSQLRNAAAIGELEMWLQPKRCLGTGRILGMEGLVRWRHPVRGYVSPADFIPFAERSGQIGVVTRTMMDAALTRLAAWRKVHPDMSIAVNVSALDVQDMSFVGQVEQLARRHDAPLDRLRLEITESSVMEDPDRVLPVLHALRRIGVQLSIDDFGTGYSSLAHLHRLPVSELKIDRSFVSNADQKNEARALLQTIIDLGHSLKMIVTAEGIERPQELELLTHLGCDQAQGYLISKPLSPQDAKKYLEALTLALPPLISA